MEKKKSEDNFKCLRCGRCCLRVSLVVSVPPEDVEKWVKAGRDDILAWVSIFPDGGADIWLNKYSGDDDIPVNCPWLQKDDDNNLSCSIQDLKPTCCAGYGHDKDHALKTKCTFYTGKPFKPSKNELKRIPTINKWKDYHLDMAIRVPDKEGIDEWDILNFIKYKITGEKYFYNELGVDTGLPPKDVFSKLNNAITIFKDEIEED